MKKYLLLGTLLGASLVCPAQILKKIADRAKNRAENNATNKVNNAVDKTVDEVMNPETYKNNGVDTTKKENPAAGKDLETGPGGFKTYSRYDFVPGERILAFEDFMQDAVGDFPARWNTNATGEIMTIDKIPGHWFAMGKAGVFMPDFIDVFPEDFTLEFDLLINKTAHSWGIYINLAELSNRDQPKEWASSKNYFSLNILPGNPGNGSSGYDRRKKGVGETRTTAKITQFENNSRPVHVAFWRQKERLRIYLNEEKTWDIPKAILPEAKLNALVFAIQNIAGWHYLVSNLRLAVGAPDSRKKILEQNKWVTHGILFDVNSANIKPESYGTLKEMANVLKEYADLRVKIVGHTDADGKDDANLDLSKRRAASVKASLSIEFGIEESRLETDGKGESEPIDKNDTPAGKANNRRVEFIKL